MINVLVSLLLELVDFCRQLPLVFLAVLNLPHGAKRSLSWRKLIMHCGDRVLHNHVIITLHQIGVFVLVRVIYIVLMMECGYGTVKLLIRGTTLHFHHDPLLLNCLWIGCNASHLSYSLLFELPLPRLHLLDEDLRLQIVRLDLADKLLVSRMLLSGYAWIFLLTLVCY